MECRVMRLATRNMHIFKLGELQARGTPSSGEASMFHTRYLMNEARYKML